MDADIYKGHVAQILSHTMEDVFRIQVHNHRHSYYSSGCGSGDSSSYVVVVDSGSRSGR